MFISLDVYTQIDLNILYFFESLVISYYDIIN